MRVENTETRSSTAKSADRALAVLQLLAGSNQTLPTAAIAQECNIPKSSTHNLLNIMRDRGFLVYRERERQWSLGPSTIEVAAAYTRSDPLQVEARHVLESLTRTLGYTAHLALLRGTEVLYVDKRDAKGLGVRLVTEIGSRLPACLTSVGHAILAFTDHHELARLYEDYPWSTTHTVGPGPRSFEALEHQLETVRMNGIAHDVGMVSSGISCVAAPIFDRRSRAAAAIGITFVTAQVDDDTLHRITAHVRSAAAHLSQVYGDTSTMERQT